MREGDRRGAAGVDRGVVRGRAVRLSATLESEALCFLGSVSAKLHICLTPGAVVWQSGAACAHSRLPSWPSESKSLHSYRLQKTVFQVQTQK